MILTFPGVLGLKRFLKRIDEIKNHEITKNISTPIKPPGNLFGKAWYKTTAKHAIARKPSISAR